MAVTVKTVCQDALRELGVLDAVEPGTAADIEAAFHRFNRLIDQWAAERLLIFTVTRTTWSFVASQASYTVGSGGDIDIVRPEYVNQVHYEDTSATIPVEIEMNPLTEDAWSLVPQHTLTSSLPTSWYYNSNFASGLATLYFWPIPTNSTLRGVMYHWTAVPEFTALSDTVALPPGYRRMMETNLALECAPIFGVQPSPVLMKNAVDSLAVVKRKNKRLMDLTIDAGALVQGRDSLNYYNINSGP